MENSMEIMHTDVRVEKIHVKYTTFFQLHISHLQFSEIHGFQVVWRKLSDEPEQRQNGTNGHEEEEILEDLLQTLLQQLL